MARFERFCAAAAAVGALALGCGGCAPEEAACALGEHSPEEAIGAFLEAASRDDPDGVQAELAAILDVDSAAVAELAAALEGEDQSTWRLWPSQMGSEHIYRVTTSSGSFVGTFSVVEGEPECWCVAWGIERPEDEPV